MANCRHRGRARLVEQLLAAGAPRTLNDLHRRLYLRPDFFPPRRFLPLRSPAKQAETLSAPEPLSAHYRHISAGSGPCLGRVTGYGSTLMSISGHPMSRHGPAKPARSRGGGGGLRRLASQAKQRRKHSFRQSELAEKLCRLRPVVRRCRTSGPYRQRSTRAGCTPVRVPGR
jgi:hypothetical protein